MQTFPPIHEISDKAMLHEYLGERQAAKDFRTMIAIIERLSELEHRTSVRANYAHVIGVIYRDELRELEPAKRSFERVLALDPSHPNATRALAKLKLSD